MNLKEIYDLVRGFNCLCNIQGKNITHYSSFYDDWEVVRLFATKDGLLKIILEDPNKTEGKNENEQKNLLHKTETNRLAASVDQYNNTDNGQRKCDNNPVSNATGNIPDDNEGKNNVSERETSTKEETKMTLADRILEMMYQAYLEREFDEEIKEIGECELFDFDGGLSYLNDCYNSDIRITLDSGAKETLSTIISDAAAHGEQFGFKRGFIIGMLFGSQINSKPINFNQPKENT